MIDDDNRNELEAALPTHGNQAYSLDFRSVGEDVVIWPRAHVVNAAEICIGDSVIIDDFVFIHGAPGMAFGSFIHVASFTSIVGGGEFTMEDFAGLSGGVRVYTGNEDYTGGSLTNPAVPGPYRVPIRSYVRLRAHSIVGANAVILPGVEIGEGAVVGSQALVTRDCAPWTINVGAPAKPIKDRARDRILELEAQLREDLYDAAGRYVPSHRR